MITAIIIIVAFIINLVIIYNIIQSATKSNQLLNLNRAQVELLMEMALKNGVEPHKVREIIEKHNV